MICPRKHKPSGQGKLLLSSLTRKCVLSSSDVDFSKVQRESLTSLCVHRKSSSITLKNRLPLRGLDIINMFEKGRVDKRQTHCSDTVYNFLYSLRCCRYRTTLSVQCWCFLSILNWQLIVLWKIIGKASLFHFSFWDSPSHSFTKGAVNKFCHVYTNIAISPTSVMNLLLLIIPILLVQTGRRCILKNQATEPVIPQNHSR